MLIEQNEFYISGISVRTINKDGKSGTAIKALWERFFNDGVLVELKNKISNEIYCIYTDYERDHTGYYTAVLGSRVESLKNIPEGMVGITIAAGKYEVCTLEGKCPQNVLSAWQEIWDSDINRRYATDYDVYTPNFQSFEDSEVKIFLSVK